MHLFYRCTMVIRVAFVFWVQAAGMAMVFFVVTDHLLPSSSVAYGAVGFGYLCAWYALLHEWHMLETQLAREAVEAGLIPTCRQSLADAYHDFTESSAVNGFVIGFFAPVSLVVYKAGQSILGKRDRASIHGGIFFCANHLCARHACQNAALPAHMIMIGSWGRARCGSCGVVVAFLGYEDARRTMARAGFIGGALYPIVTNQYSALLIVLHAALGALTAIFCFRRDRWSQAPI